MIKCLGRCWKRTENSHRKSETCFQGIHSLFIYQQIHSFNINSFIHFFFFFFYFYFYFSYLQFLSKCPFQSIFFLHFSSFIHKFSFQIFPYSFKNSSGGRDSGMKGQIWHQLSRLSHLLYFSSKKIIYFPNFNIFS